MRPILYRGALTIGLLGVWSVVPADTIEFSGYMRAGTGINTDGGRMTCFQLPETDYKWRLGNECDYVIEPELGATLAEGEDGSRWGVLVMPSAWTAWGLEEGDLEATFGQAYAYGENIEALGGGRVWAGRRFYDRVQFGINDYFMENRDGDGAGIEDINVGIGKLSYAFLMDPNQPADNANITHSLRLTEIPTLPGNHLDIYTAYSHNQSTSDADNAIDNDDGISVALYHTTSGTLGGDTIVGIQYRDYHTPDDDGVNPAAQDHDGDLYRIHLQQTGFIDAAATQWDLIAQYRLRDFEDGPEDDWYSLGARTDTHITGPFRFLLEVGHDRLNPDEGDNLNMTKATAALALSAGPDAWSRPTVRFFATHAQWNSEVNDAGGPLTWDDDGTTAFADKTSGTSVGAQVETWW